MADVLKDLLDSGYTPEVNKDDEFKPVNGKYVCRIDSAGRVSGTSERTGGDYDFYSINIQVVEIVDGDRATNRFFRLRYNNNQEGIKKMLNDLFTAGQEIQVKTQEELNEALTTLTDATMSVRTWAWTPTTDMQGNPIPEEERRPLQSVRVVKEFKGTTKAEKAHSNIPF